MLKISSAFCIDNKVFLKLTTFYVNKIFSTFPHSFITLIDDFNLPSNFWRSYSIPDTVSQVMIDNLNNLNYLQVFSEPPHTKNKTLKLTIKNKPELVANLHLIL